LSLLLKVLEEETGQLTLGFERALPDLNDNIKCGNSLIGWDYFEGQLLPDRAEVERVNPFDWEKNFPEIFAQGGFDAVIGNPPYVDIKSLCSNDVNYLFEKYSSANNRINLFAIFIQKSLEIVRQTEFKFSMIIPTALLTQDSYKSLRSYVNSDFCLSKIARLPNESFGKIAGDVKVDTAIIVISDQQEQETEIISYSGYERIKRIDPKNAEIHRIHNFKDWADDKDNIWSLTKGEISEKILTKCELKTVSLEECVDFSLGLTPYDKYKGQTQQQIKNKVFHANYQKDDTYKRLLAGNNVRRYDISWNGNTWISYGPWLGAPREQRFFTSERILVKQIIDWSSKRIWASLTSEELYNTQNAFNLLAKNSLSLKYILGILNSKLITYYHRKKYLDEFKMRFQKILIKDAKRIPIRIIDNDIIEEVQKYKQIIGLVDQMLKLHKNDPKTPFEREQLEREIHATDSQIDRLVYDLYGLTEEEIKIVERETNG